MLALTLAVCLAPGAPIPPPRSRPVYVFASLTVEQAKLLAGRTVRVKANITDPDPEHAGAHSPDDNLRCVVWRKGEGTLDEGRSSSRDGLGWSSSRTTRSTANGSGVLSVQAGSGPP